jgi:hypothetical protein
VIPIVKALTRELGKERAHAIVGAAIAGDYARWQSERIPLRNLHPRTSNENNVFPVEASIVDDTDTTFAVSMTKCRFAE